MYIYCVGRFFLNRIANLFFLLLLLNPKELIVYINVYKA